MSATSHPPAAGQESILPDAHTCLRLPGVGRDASVRWARALVLVAGLWVAATGCAQVTDTAGYLQRMDVDGDGRVSEQEYVQWMLYAFDRMDLDADGTLAPHELPGGKGRPITREQQRQTLMQRFHRQDANGDGYLDARELAAPPR